MCQRRQNSVGLCDEQGAMKVADTRQPSNRARPTALSD